MMNMGRVAAGGRNWEGFGGEVSLMLGKYRKVTDHELVRSHT